MRCRGKAGEPQMREKQLRACIVTMNNASCNFGNKLQNYAAKAVLEEMGIQADTLAFQKQHDPLNIMGRMAMNRLSGYRFSPTNAGLKRSLKYSRFVKRYIPTKVVRSDFQELKDRYDIFCIGSDQVWNPEWYDDVKKEVYLLTFARPEQKVCMAPSFGVDQLPEEWEGWFREQLMTFPRLAVRERSGAELIRRLTGRDAMVMLDPTMMLPAEKWRKIASPSPARTDGERYLLTYFLGRQQPDARKQIEAIAAGENLRVLNLNSPAEEELFSTDPAEFLDLMDHAELVCTDSFHACVFSVLFDKPFLVYRRVDDYRDMFSRIDGLLTLLQLRQRLPGAVPEADIFWHDYENAYAVLETERKAARSFLRESMALPVV